MRNMSVDDLVRVHEQLEATGRIHEITDVDGKIQPSEKSLETIAVDHPDADDAEKWRLAQADTLMDLAEKYENELN